MRILIVDTRVFTEGWSYSVIEEGQTIHIGKILVDKEPTKKIIEIAKEREVESIAIADFSKSSNWIVEKLRKETDIKIKNLGEI